MTQPRIKATDLLNDVRSGMSDIELMAKYRLPEMALHYLLRRLTEFGMMSHLELYERSSLSEAHLTRAFVDAKHTVLTCRVCGGEIPDGAETCPYCALLERNFSGTMILDAADLVAKTSNGGGSLRCESEWTTEFREQEERPSQPDVTYENLLDVAISPASELTESRERADLLRAASQGDRELVEMLLEMGTDVNCRSAHLNTPLIRSAFKGHLPIAQLLIARGADIEARNCQGHTPLMVASNTDSGDMVSLLLAGGANPRVKNAEGYSALTIAVNDNRTEIVKLLLACGADANEFTNEKDTPLMRASHKGYLDMAALLLDAGADVDARNKHGNTALMKASFKGHLEIVKLLLKARADVNARNVYGNTALIKAAFKGREAVVRRLLEAGADANATDNSGNNAFMRAVNGGHHDIVDLLRHFVAAPTHTRQG